MIDLAFEVEPPSPDSDDARLHVIDYVRLPAMLELFEEKAGFSLGSSILDTFLPAPMPLDSHKTVIDHAKFIMDTWGKSTILVRAPVGNKLSNIVQDHKIVKLRYEDIRRRMKKNKIALKKQKKQNKDFTEEISALKTHNSYMEKQVQDLTNDSIARYDYQFTIFRGNILLDLIRKLLPEEAKQARHRATGIKGSTLAENYAEADFKEATKKFDVCNESAHMMEIFQKFGSFVQERNVAAHQSQLEMARLLTSPIYRKQKNNQFWSHLFEYVYGDTVEEVVQKWDMMDESGGP